MYWIIKRAYSSSGTNGALYDDKGKLICYTIERPWLDNAKGRSCIPEGSYVVQKRYSPKFKWHLHLTDVKGRDLILIHPANNAIKELRGCIAPVSKLTGAGTGIESRKAMQMLMDLFDAYRKQPMNEEPFILNITS